MAQTETVQLKCGVEGCGMTWGVATRQMKASMAEHRQQFHPDGTRATPRPLWARLDRPKPKSSGSWPVRP